MNNQTIKLCRLALGKTQKQVAAQAAITEQYYQRVEARRAVPSVEIAQRLAIALENTVEHLWPIIKKEVA